MLPVVVVPEPPQVLPQFALTPAAATAVDSDPAEIVGRWMAALSPGSRASYRRGLQNFACWALGAGTPPTDALAVLVEGGVGHAHQLVGGWRDAMLAEGKLATGSIAGAITAICSLVKQLRRCGRIGWHLEGVGVKVERKHDRRGPRRVDVERLQDHLDRLAAAGDGRAVRDLCILRLGFTAAMRRSEIVGLRYPDDLALDAEGGPVVRPKRKGRRCRSDLLVTEGIAGAIRAWLQVRGVEPGPLFHRLDRGEHRRQPLTGESVRKMLATRAQEAGVKAPVRPHGLRHAAASEVARRGSLAELRAIGQWKSLSSIEHYLDKEDAERASAMGMLEL